MDRRGLGFLLVFILCGTTLVQGTEIPDEHEEVYPKKVLPSGELSSTLSTYIGSNENGGLHETNCQYQVEFEGQLYFIDLELNTRILSKSLTLTDGSNGQTTFPSKKDINYSQYTGTAYKITQPASKKSYIAFFEITEVMEGMIDTSDAIMIIPHDGGHVALRRSAIKQEKPTICGNDALKAAGQRYRKASQPLLNLPINEDFVHQREKRDIGDRTKYMEIIFIIPFDLYQYFEGSVIDMSTALLRLTNAMDCFYKPIGIRIVLRHIEYFSQGDPFAIDLENFVQVTSPGGYEIIHGSEHSWKFALPASITPTMTLFSGEAYIKTRILLDPEGSPWRNVDHVVLLNNASFAGQVPEGTVLGVARLWQMCSAHSLSYMGFHNDPVDRMITDLVAVHEIGHSLGLRHDEDYLGCVCGETNCIMNARVVEPFATKWSNCSKQVMADELAASTGRCLLNVPEPSMLEQINSCGNKYLELGEQCDCGTVSECENFCCNPRTCQLYDFAQCDGSQPCCNAATCQFAAAGTMCRKLCDTDCDLPEYCDGNNATCPEDSRVEDGAVCNSGLDRCKNGFCLTLDRQCEQLFGEGATESSINCYGLNLRGDTIGNCGVNGTGSYIPCPIVDAYCGKIYCDGAENLFRPASIQTQVSFANFSDGTICYIYTEPPSPGVFDFSYVQDGSACLNNVGTCEKGRCNAHTSLCTLPCNGTCNDAGNCFCADGLAPPNCTMPGNGGSIDSGPPPIANPNCDSHNTSVKWNDNSTVKSELEMDVVCGQKITISFNLCPFIARGYNIDDLVIIAANEEYDPLQENVTVAEECIAKPGVVVAGDKWRASISFRVDVCGGEMESGDTLITISNRFRAIRTGRMDQSETIVRVRPEVIYDFSCKYERSLYSQISTQPNKNTLFGYEMAHKYYEVEMSFFADASYSDKIQVDRDVVVVGNRVFVLLEMKENQADLVLQTLKCWISHTADIEAEPLYHVIEDRCPAVDLLGKVGANAMSQNCINRQSRFSFLAFSHPVGARAKKLHLHCKVQTCQSNLFDCSCSVCGSVRRKRSHNRNFGTEKVLTIGPLLLGL